MPGRIDPALRRRDGAQNDRGGDRRSPGRLLQPGRTGTRRRAHLPLRRTRPHRQRCRPPTVAARRGHRPSSGIRAVHPRRRPLRRGLLPEDGSGPDRPRALRFHPRPTAPAAGLPSPLNDIPLDDTALSRNETRSASRGWRWTTFRKAVSNNGRRRATGVLRPCLTWADLVFLSEKPRVLLPVPPIPVHGGTRIARKHRKIVVLFHIEMN